MVNVDLAISIKGLRKSYGSHEVLKGLDLEVREGELFAFIGSNGAGKSTTIDSLIGIKTFDEGEISIGGHSIVKDAIAAKKIIGYVPSEPLSYDQMSGLRYLEFIGSIYKVEDAVFEKNLDYLSKRLDLSPEDLSRPIKEYSHGMQQKLGLIASLIHNPHIWVMDEPTVGLDAVTSHELTLMMKEFSEHGRTVFVASHNIEMVSSIADRIAIIYDGVINRVFDLREDPSLRYEVTPYFLSLSKMEKPR